MSAAELFFKRLKHYRGAAEHRQRSFDLISNLRL